jgi:magnesium chelatase family protein|tara:strand:- start:309 stop:968 length:660 start_codon:yes stop_codon:yes gene_type:complete
MNTPCFSDIRGLHSTVDEFVDAVARRDRILLIEGGRGSVMLAQRTNGLLPKPTEAEQSSIDATRQKMRMPTTPGRSFRAPHHTTSWAGIFGSADGRRVGEMGLAQHGTLCLFDAPEFPRRIVEGIGLAMQKSLHNMMLIATAKPCPCGMFMSHNKPCTCTPQQLERWGIRLDALCKALAINKTITVPWVSTEETLASPLCPTTAELKSKNKRAVAGSSC